MLRCFDKLSNQSSVTGAQSPDFDASMLRQAQQPKLSNQSSVTGLRQAQSPDPERQSKGR
jgi:hypothetical protein